MDSIPQTEGWTECDGCSEEGRPRDEKKAVGRRATNDTERNKQEEIKREHTETKRKTRVNGCLCVKMYIPLNITYASMVLKIEHIEDGHG